MKINFLGDSITAGGVAYFARRQIYGLRPNEKEHELIADRLYEYLTKKMNLHAIG